MPTRSAPRQYRIRLDPRLTCLQIISMRRTLYHEVAMDTLKFDLISPTASIWRAKRKGRHPGTARLPLLHASQSLAVAASMPAGVETRIIDENVEPVDFDTDADLIGITFMTFNAPRAYEIAARFRDHGKTVIFGGFHPTFLPYEAIAHCDAVCVGEAEYNVPRMIEDYRAGQLQSHLPQSSGWTWRTFPAMPR